MTGWRARASCRWWPSDWWHPVGNGQAEGKQALRICGECPVARECLIEAMRTEEHSGYRHGIWGGTTARQRQRLATSWKETDGKDDELHG